MMKRIMSYILVFVMIVVLLPEKIIFASDLVYDAANMGNIGLPKSIELETEGLYEYITLDIENVDLFIENTNIAEIGSGFWTDPSGMTDFSIIPKAVGETILTAVTPNGDKYECTIKVVPNISETISDDVILKAKVLSNSERYHYYKNTYGSPVERLNNEQKKRYAAEYANTYLFVDDLLSVLSLNFETGEDLKASKYYEAVLTDILENNRNNVWDKAYASWNSIYKVYNNEIIKKITGQIVKLDNVKTLDFIKNNEEKRVIETIVDYSNEQGVLKDVEIKVDLLDKLSLSADLINDFFDAVNYMYAYSAVQQEKIDILRDLSENAIDRNLSAACTNLIEDIKFAQKSTVEYFVSNFGKGAAYDLFEFSTGIISALVLGYITVDTAGVNPYIPGIKEALAIIKSGRFFSNTIINADDISKDVLTVSVYTSIENEIKIRATKAEINFDSNMTRENAIKFIAYADFFKSALINSHDVYINYVNDVKKGDNRLNITGDILRFISGDISGFLRSMHNEDTSYDDMINTAERLKNTIVDEDFYYSYDVVEYISNIETTTPSDWATEYIDNAIEESLLPEYMQGNYQNNITRAEFCTLLTNLIEKSMDSTIQQIIQDAPYDPKIFRDSYYSYVYYMACLGIVNGVTEDEFDPLGEITREQAAVLLMRTADFLDIDISAKNYQYEDVSSWAKDGVNFVVDKNIMSGTNNGFEPQSTYTKEQAVTSIVRFYKQFNVDPSSYIGRWNWNESVHLYTQENTDNWYDHDYAYVDIKSVSGNNITFNFFRWKGGVHLSTYEDCTGVLTDNQVVAYTYSTNNDTSRRFKMTLTLYGDYIHINVINESSNGHVVFDGDCHRYTEKDFVDIFNSLVGKPYIHMLIDDYDMDGNNEAYVITGERNDNYSSNSFSVYNDITVWFIGSNGNCRFVDSPLGMGNYTQTVETINAKYISIETSGGGSSGWSNIYGVRDEFPFSPEISGKYGGFGKKDGKYVVVLNDFSNGYHDYIDTEIFYDAENKEFYLKE